MADLVITAANVVAGSTATVVDATAGASVTAGQLVYRDSATDSLKLCDNDSATAAARSPYGIALHAASSGQPLAVLTKGPITIGATTAVGVVYTSSSTAGGICPNADNGTGDYVSIVGIGTSTTAIDVLFHEAGAAMA